MWTDGTELVSRILGWLYSACICHTDSKLLGNAPVFFPIESWAQAAQFGQVFGRVSSEGGIRSQSYVMRQKGHIDSMSLVPMQPIVRMGRRQVIESLE